MTRLLAEMQTSIIIRGLALTGGDLGAFAILSLIIRQTVASEVAPFSRRRSVAVKSLADSLSQPYESVRRRVDRLVANGLCERDRSGASIAAIPASRARLEPVLAHTHDAFVRFVGDLAAFGDPLPAVRAPLPYRRIDGISAAVDVMLTVLDGNRGSHREWLQLVIFSTTLCLNVTGFARDCVRATALADETHATPLDWLKPVPGLAIARVLGLPETSVRRHIDALQANGRVIRQAGGLIVNEAWLNLADNVAVSRASYANVHRILHQLAARGFPFDAVNSAYMTCRPADVAIPAR